MNCLDKARKYVNENTIENSKKCLVHLTPETGWLNDPNGFSYYKDEYHMFYQFNPYSTQWSSMHWGHATSKDCIKWQYKPVALAPEFNHKSARACYSGSAITVGEKHYLMYTQNSLFQTQRLAISDDGIEYKKVKGNVISQKHLPKYGFLGEFRDPKVWQKDGMYYCLLGNRNFKSHKGCNIILYKSKDMHNWQLVGKLFDNDYAIEIFDNMAECPDFFEIDGKDVVIISPWRKQKVIYSVGKLDYNTGKFTGCEMKLVDFGTDFFATQSVVTQENETLLTAWAQPTISSSSTMKPYGFNGLLTIPRKVSLDGENLVQMPIDTLKDYRFNKVSFDGELSQNTAVEISGDVLDIDLEFSDVKGKVGVQLFSDMNGKGLNVYHENGKLFIDRTHNYTDKVETQDEYLVRSDVDTIDGKLKLRVVLDRFIVEVFVNDGQKAFSTLVSPTMERLGVMLISDDTAKCKGEFYKLK